MIEFRGRVPRVVERVQVADGAAYYFVQTVSSSCSFSSQMYAVCGERKGGAELDASSSRVSKFRLARELNPRHFYTSLLGILVGLLGN